MSYTTPPPPLGAPTPAARPGTVSLATTLLYLLTVLSLISIALSVYTATFYDRAKVEQIYRDAGADRAIAESQATGLVVGSYLGAGLGLLLVAGYLVCAIFVGRGKQWARILAWVWAGLFGICCGIGGLVVLGASNALTGSMGNVGGIDQKKVQEDLQALVPDWLNSATMVLGIISVLAAIAVVILLALPPSSPYFRKQEAQWTPPTYPAP
ncbi:hypothetical protein [Allorhizocola rhizosphaerae]|uniref:hypothetical protein n=1 Tax=Allorhizocola rhizosphaerae TaxID=1872709 RepID=UPI000E3B7F63|nr:hypothetical protein [Allorhizocola rhizosphaerae]